MADWTWQPTIGDDIATKGLVLSVALGIGAVGCLAAAAFMDDVRFLLIVGLMLATLVWLGRSSTKQARTLQVTVDRGIATFADSRRTTTVDLRTLESIDVSSRGDYQAGRRWAIEAVGPGTAVEHRIANVEQYWSLDSAEMAELRRGLQHYHQWYRSNATPAAATPAAATPVAQAAASAPTSHAQGDSFEWRIPRHPNADRNRKRVAIISILIAGALAAAGIVSAWPDPLGVILSIVVLPGIVGLLGGGLWWAYTPVRRFRLTAADGVLFVHPTFGSKPPREVQLAGATDVVVDTSTNLVATGTGSHTRQTTTYIKIDPPDGGSSERIALPNGPGSAMNAEQRLLLESQLRRLAGIA